VIVKICAVEIWLSTNLRKNVPVKKSDFTVCNFLYIFSQLQGLVDFDGYYLESDPCLVCNNPEVPYANTKLTSIKVDSKFTTTTQIVKLVGSHTISKVTLRITDLKRTKMVRGFHAKKGCQQE
jgi:hypothetical protein